MAEVLVDLLEQLGVLVDELFLLEIDELAERHLQDRVGLHGRERILVGDAALLLVLAEADVAERALQHGGGRLDRDEPLFGLGLRLRGADHADHFVDVGVREQQALHRVLAAAGAGQQELRPPANDVKRCRTNSCSISLSESVRGLPSTSASRMIENESCSGVNL